MLMPIYDPAFDPLTRTWFTECGAEAETIRELLAQLPRGSKVKNYFPNGRLVIAVERGSGRTIPKPPTPKPIPQEAPPPASPQPPLSTLGATMWADGRLQPVPPIESPALSQPITEGDGRRRNRGTGRKYDRDAVLNAWLRGAGIPEIAAAQGMAKEAVGALIQVARQRGDSRALKAGDSRRRRPE